MNLPEYTAAIERAGQQFHRDVNEAREQFDKAIAVARSAFFEEQDKAVDAVRVTRRDEPR